MRAILTIIAITCIGASSALAQQQQPCPSLGPLNNFFLNLNPTTPEAQAIIQRRAECEFERSSRLTNYVRTDGAPVNAAQGQATLAQCKGEAVTTVTDIRRESAVLDACMARNGYIHPQR